jgi:hypothetical protein
MARCARTGGRLLFPMTTVRNGPGAMLLVTRQVEDGFAPGFCAGWGSSISRVLVIRRLAAGSQPLSVATKGSGQIAAL